MDNKEILEKVSGKKAYVGEYENQGINKSNWISIIVAGIVAVVFIIVFGALRMKEVCFAIGAICFTWACVFYFCQYFIAKLALLLCIALDVKFEDVFYFE